MRGTLIAANLCKQSDTAGNSQHREREERIIQPYITDDFLRRYSNSNIGKIFVFADSLIDIPYVWISVTIALA